jgi:hypothetical protein
MISAILALYFLFSSQKKYLTLLYLALAFIFFPFIEENVQIGNSKTLFHTGNLQSPNRVLNRNNRNSLLGPGRYREDICFENKKNNS